LQSEDLKQLHTDCLRTLKRYIEEAQHTCTVLDEVQEFPVPHHLLLKILEQRQSENDAHEAYQIARTRLFVTARWRKAGDN